MADPFWDSFEDDTLASASLVDGSRLGPRGFGQPIEQDFLGRSQGARTHDRLLEEGFVSLAGLAMGVLAEEGDGAEPGPERNERPLFYEVVLECLRSSTDGLADGTEGREMRRTAAEVRDARVAPRTAWDLDDVRDLLAGRRLGHSRVPAWSRRRAAPAPTDEEVARLAAWAVSLDLDRLAQNLWDRGLRGRDLAHAAASLAFQATFARVLESRLCDDAILTPLTIDNAPQFRSAEEG